MSEQSLVFLTIALVTIVALVVVLAIVAMARREAKNIDVGDKPTTITIGGVTGPVTIGQDARAPVVQSQVLKQSIKLHLSLLTFLPPSFTLLGLLMWWADSSLAPISNTLLWASLTLLIPAIYGELYRAASVLSRMVLILDVVFFVLLGLTMVVPRLMTVEVLMGMAVAVIGFAIASRAVGRAA